MSAVAEQGRWIELGAGVLARRHAELDLTTGLVIGAKACLAIDTRGDAAQGAELARAIRERTPLPWSVVLTHAHFDHAFGTPAFRPCPVWAHPGCRAALAADPAATEVAPPEELVAGSAVLNLGGRIVRLIHLGPAHTDHDLVVQVPDAGVVFAGDLVEHEPGGSFSSESFGADTTISGWPAALDGILALRPRIVVPGHGEPVDPEFVAAQREPLAELAGLCAAGLAPEDAVARSPYPRAVTLAALASVSRS
ncbi:MBL fold metallo-hydrolase [Amycolatopsis cihanbeyliensis]|uniref:Glyoxylase-like metal-dependent hydrolase (Beta-lactamase superfamily II) n=1 Tax=Amycolatopsis cihanbeyliensis TaxID=1128664 RepID=A0A542CTY4_AMYCI|nr:MBL fold metallo-hydrolase [Amycolatopsis cihanbeyliensis]TQI94250.1 glyoxylase-like metal-dependent hydrolase (beta-lactamase superfamily II) [Amycolatopsis cihanbeyliensis]